ncbi:hypothetical protein NDU88_005615 [Pleurodeles waltl]|uniref:Uncharacterized protein n=1 Tax=Pleurodeles waltl TaxID=8319 RepID=A0AAV7TUH1_PLEWA|nr:hypothetical protein NDU88_005615 [Pleurodeles waltl]
MASDVKENKKQLGDMMQQMGSLELSGDQREKELNNYQQELLELRDGNDDLLVWMREEGVLCEIMFMNDAEVVKEKRGMSLDDGANECDDGSVENVDVPVLQKRIRKPPSYLEDFIR